MRFPRTRAARLVAELAELRDTQARTEETACAAAARIEEMFAVMREEIGTPAPLSPRHGLHLVSTDERKAGCGVSTPFPPEHAPARSRPPQPPHAAGRRVSNPGGAA